MLAPALLLLLLAASRAQATGCQETNDNINGGTGLVSNTVPVSLAYLCFRTEHDVWL